MRFPDWHGSFSPQLGDVIAQETACGALDHDQVRRAYRLVGVEETRTGFRLVGERIEYAEPDWTYYNVPRG